MPEGKKKKKCKNVRMNVEENVMRVIIEADARKNRYIKKMSVC